MNYIFCYRMCEFRSPRNANNKILCRMELGTVDTMYVGEQNSSVY